MNVDSGYTGGPKPNPTYEEVCSGASGHYEAIEVTFDPKKIRYDQLLDVFWVNVDPTQDDGQFADHGPQYKTAIFYHDDEQKKLAQKSKEVLAKSGRFKSPLVTEILPAAKFYPAENYHQDYYKKNPIHYKMYSLGSGRAGFIQEMWKDKLK